MVVGGLDTLPPELVMQICLFLPGPSIATLGQACRHLRDVTSDRELWAVLFSSDFDLLAADRLSLLFHHPKRVYQTRLETLREAQSRVTARRESDARAVETKLRQKKLISFINALNVIAVAALPYLLILFLAILAARLDGGIDWSLWTVFFPIWAMAALLFLVSFGASLCAAWLSYYRVGTSVTSVWSGLMEQLLGTPVVWYLRLSIGAGHGKVAAIHSALLALMVMILPFTLVMKFDGVGGEAYNYGTAFLPLWLAFALHAASPLFRSGLTSAQNAFRFHIVLWVALLVPSLAVFVTLAISLDGAFIPLHLIFIPWWVVNGIIVLTGAISLINALWMVCRRRTSATACGEFSAVFLAISAVVVPPLLFLILLAYKVDTPSTSLPWRSVFGPMFFLLAIGAIISILFASAVMEEHVRRPWRSSKEGVADPFGAATATAPARRARPARLHHGGRRAARQGAGAGSQAAGATAAAAQNAAS